jgi:hypothetical protein
LIHGRDFSVAIGWDSGGLLETRAEVPNEAYGAVHLITDALALSIRQIRLATLSLAEVAGKRADVAALAAIGDTFSEADPEDIDSRPPINSPDRRFTRPSLPGLMPLLPSEGLAPGPLSVLEKASWQFEQVLAGWKPNGEFLRDDQLLYLDFMWHRNVSAISALKALKLEEEELGDDFDLGSLGSRASQWVIVTEAASLAGRWVNNQHVAAALSLIGSGLRSAYWLWLEDDDRAMSILRSILEQASRSRAWRTKPEKAAELETRHQTTPRDWLEAAGWRRLAALNRALGEFAHVKPNSRWIVARNLLSELQMNADPESAIHRAHGASLDFVSLLVARETLAWCEQLSSTLAKTLSSVFTRVGFGEVEHALEAALNHMWTHRGDDLGEPVFREATKPSRKVVDR